jgi:hypothetical protein
MADMLKEFAHLDWSANFLRSKNEVKGFSRDAAGQPEMFYVSGLAVTVEKAISEAFKENNILSLLASTQTTKSIMLRYAAFRRVAKGKHVFFLNAVPHLDLRKQNLQDARHAGAYWLDKYTFSTYLRLGEQAILRSAYHNDVMTFMRVLKEDPTNVYIFADEAAFGTQWDSIYSKVVAMVLEAKANLLLCTATPFDQISADVWRDKIRILHLSHAVLKKAGYWGVTDFLSARKVKDIKEERAVAVKAIAPAMQKALNEFCSQGKHNFFLIRLDSDDQIAQLKSYIARNYKEIAVYQHTAKEKFQFEMMPRLTGHHVIVFKDLMRVGFRLPDKKPIWGVWEQATSMDTLVQGLIGRVTGILCGNEHIRIFSSKETLECYSLYERTGFLKKPEDKRIGVRVKMKMVGGRRIQPVRVQDISSNFQPPMFWSDEMRETMRTKVRAYFTKLEPKMSCIISFTSRDKSIYYGAKSGTLRRHKRGLEVGANIKHPELGEVSRLASINIQDEVYGGGKKLSFKVSLVYWRTIESDVQEHWVPTVSEASLFQTGRLPKSFVGDAPPKTP